jgi:hypothetical protein
MNQSKLFQQYCIDACAILDFWDNTQSRTRPYHVKVKTFRVIWEHISSKIKLGAIIVPKAIAIEIGNVTDNEELKIWLKQNNKLFIDHSLYLKELAEIVNRYPIYTTHRSSIGDAILIAIAKANKLTVITSETYSKQHSPIRPKIPNVCEDFSVKWVNLPEFFEGEGL